MQEKFSALKARARKKNLEVTLSFSEYKRMKLGACYYCGVENSLLHFYAEHTGVRTPWMSIDRKDNAAGYTPENSVGACFLCNKIKGSFFTSEEMLLIGRLIIGPKLKKFEEQVWDTYVDFCRFGHVDSEHHEFED